MVFVRLGIVAYLGFMTWCVFMVAWSMFDSGNIPAFILATIADLCCGALTLNGIHGFVVMLWEERKERAAALNEESLNDASEKR